MSARHPLNLSIIGTNVRGGVLSEALVAILCVVVVVWWGLFRWKRRHLYRLASQLPGPPTLPIFGNLFQLMFDPKEFAITGIKYCMNYPSPFRLWLGPFLYVVVHDPEDAQIVLTNSAALEKGVIYNTLKNTFGNGILTAPVQQWKKNRRLISPAFNTKLLEQFLTIFNRKNRLMVKLLEQETGKESFDVYSYCELMDLDVICETSLGVDIGAQTRHYRDFINAMSSASHIVTVRALNFWMHPDFIYKRTKLYRKEMRATQIIHQLPKSVIRQKREEYKRKKAEIEEGGVLEAEDCGGERRLKNFLDILMGSSEGEGILSDEELLDEVVTMVLAGSETTAVTNSFALLMLGMHQDIQEKVYDEIMRVFGDSDRDATMEDLNRLVYMEQVIKETLRRWPLIAILMRSATEDLQLSKYKIPAGSTIIVPPSIVHLRRDIYPDPYKFDPDRFAPENMAKRHKYTFMAFGGGPRSCIGSKFAMLSMKTTLVIFLRKYKVYTDLKMRDIQVTIAVTSRSVNGYPIRIEPRSPPQCESYSEL